MLIGERSGRKMTWELVRSAWDEKFTDSFKKIANLEVKNLLLKVLHKSTKPKRFDSE
jgi:hypothetical protein